MRRLRRHINAYALAAIIARRPAFIAMMIVMMVTMIITIIRAHIRFTGATREKHRPQRTRHQPMPFRSFHALTFPGPCPIQSGPPLLPDWDKAVATVSRVDHLANREHFRRFNSEGVKSSDIAKNFNFRRKTH
jgi:hypothetical protein